MSSSCCPPAERCLEDHERVVDIQSSWPADGSTKLLFRKNYAKYEFFKKAKVCFKLLSNMKWSAFFHICSDTNTYCDFFFLLLFILFYFFKAILPWKHDLRQRRCHQGCDFIRACAGENVLANGLLLCVCQEHVERWCKQVLIKMCSEQELVSQLF